MADAVLSKVQEVVDHIRPSERFRPPQSEELLKKAIEKMDDIKTGLQNATVNLRKNEDAQKYTNVWGDPQQEPQKAYTELLDEWNGKADEKREELENILDSVKNALIQARSNPDNAEGLIKQAKSQLGSFKIPNFRKDFENE